MILAPTDFEHYLRAFNADDVAWGGVKRLTDEAACQFLHEDLPLFACPDEDLERTYYFRWWVYGKHLRRTPAGWVVTEFLPDVPWSGPHNTISCAAGHHFREGRWLRTPRYLEDYARFWAGEGCVDYGFWYADSVLAFAHVTGDDALPVELLDALAAAWRRWETGFKPYRKWGIGDGRRDPCGLFWQVDTGEGMEFSIGGHGLRPTVNSYQYGDARAIAAVAAHAGCDDLVETYTQEAETLRRLTHEWLWDEDAEFFKTYVNEAGARPWYDWQEHAPHVYPAGTRVDVRELHGYTPWYFGLPEPGTEGAWRQLADPEGFAAPFGPTTAERRHPHFMYEHTHDCLWNGPSWPYATTQTLVALGNLLRDGDQSVVTRRDWFDLLRTYTASHRLNVGPRQVPWIDENLDPFTGEWIARARHKARDPNAPERGKDYNHSGYCDLVLGGLVGLCPTWRGDMAVDPLLPSGTWDWFALDRVRVHGRDVSVVWDRDGTHFGTTPGLRVSVNGREVASRTDLGRLDVSLA